MAVISSLVVDLEARTARLERDLARATRANRNFVRNTQRQFRGLSNQLRNFRNVATAALAIFAGGGGTRALIDAGDAIADQANNVQFAVGEYQRWQIALEAAGISQMQFTTGVTSLQRAIVEANNGLATYTRAFDAIGVNYMQLQNLSPEQQFEAVLRALEAVEDPAQRTNAALVLLGRSGRQLGDFLATGVDAALASIQGLTPVTEEAAQTASDFNDAWLFATTEIRNRLLNQLQPALQTITENMGQIVDFTLVLFNVGRIVWNALTIVARSFVGVLLDIGQVLVRIARFFGLVDDGAVELIDTMARVNDENFVEDFNDIGDALQNIADIANNATTGVDNFIGSTSTGGGLSSALGVEGASRGVMELNSSFEQLGMTIQTSLRDSLVESFREGMISASSFFDAVTNQILQISANALTNNILGGLFGGGGGGGFLGSIGGFLGFNQGGVVPRIPGSRPGVDSVPALLTPGETVVPAGEIPGGVTINNVFQTQTPEQFRRQAESSARELADIVESQFEARGR